jgi:hypothetical protein
VSACVSKAKRREPPSDFGVIARSSSFKAHSEILAPVYFRNQFVFEDVERFRIATVCATVTPARRAGESHTDETQIVLELFDPCQTISLETEVD